ncbi:MAG: response regulator [Muribaculaceae bacterium]|nr:response regulator [Muribaculaceae bacterium]
MNSKYGTILVVDDNPAILTAVKICLANVFERIITLTTPESILVTLSQEHVDIILLDMNFSLGVNSGQDGMIWLSAIHRKHPDIPVVLITAYADVKLAVKGLKNGAADFVTKPWDNDELIRVLKDAIDKTKEVVPLSEVERQHVKMVVDKCHGNMSKAAELLGITRQTLYRKYQQ